MKNKLIRLRRIKNYPNGTELLKGATNNISMNIPVAAKGKTQIPINL